MKRTIKKIISVSNYLKEINFFPFLAFILIIFQMCTDFGTLGTLSGKSMLIPVIILMYIVFKQFLFNLFMIEDDEEEEEE